MTEIIDGSFMAGIQPTLTVRKRKDGSIEINIGQGGGFFSPHISLEAVVEKEDLKELLDYLASK